MRGLATVLCALLLPAAAAAAEPRVAIFYYPWYGTPQRDGAYLHWDERGHVPPTDIAAEYYPARGAYSSGSPQVVADQVDEIAAAGVRELVSSWWGRFSIEDARLPTVLTAARMSGIEVAVHLEPYPGRTIETVRSDLAYLRSLGVRDVYIYRARDIAAAEWAALNGTLSGVRMFAQTGRVGFAAAGGFNGVYTYDIARFGGWAFRRLCFQAHAKGLLCAPSVGPGYDAVRATGDPFVKPRRDGATYDRMWSAALAAGADMVTITSYNEWGEGTQIEPAGRGNGPIGYRNYSGAYGLHGRAAQHAYLERTAYWVSRFIP